MAANAAHPREALRALRELRLELEEFERQQAARALTGGDTFSAVARALGVSRQAAHRRFRDLAPPAQQDGSERPTPEARLVVEYARREATDLGATAVGSEHLLLGILRNDDDRAAAALVESGVTLEEARTAAAVCGTTAESAAEEADAPAPARLVVRASLLEARRRRAQVVGVEHLLLGALSDRGGGAAELLGILGVSPDAVLASVEARPDAVAVDPAA